MRKALDAGASAYVLKSGASEELLNCESRLPIKDRSDVSPSFGQDVIDSFQNRSAQVKRTVIELTNRQRQILQLIAEGRQNKDIAEILDVSIKTVEFHRSSLMTKLGAHTVAELTRFANQPVCPET